MACICNTIPKALKAYVAKEDQHPPDKSTPHMHIKRGGTRLYRVEWGTNAKTGERFAKVQTRKGADKQFVSDIERWVEIKFDELTDVYNKVVSDLPFSKVKWVN